MSAQHNKIDRCRATRTIDGCGRSYEGASMNQDVKALRGAMKDVDFFTPGARLALELECLLLDTRDAARTNAMLTDALLESERRDDALLDHLDTLAMHAHRDILEDWVCIPACEWDAVMLKAVREGLYGG